MHLFVSVKIHIDCRGLLCTFPLNVNPHRKSQVAGGGAWAQSLFLQHAKDPSLEWQAGTPHVLRMDVHLRQAERDDILLRVKKKNSHCSSSSSQLLLYVWFTRVCEREIVGGRERETHPQYVVGVIVMGEMRHRCSRSASGLCAVCYLQLQNTHTYQQLLYIHAVYCSGLQHVCLLQGHTHIHAKDHFI